MAITRRNILFGAGAAAVATTAFPQLTEAFFQASALPRTASLKKDLILLSRNENPYGPFPSVQRAMQDALKRANRYIFEPDYMGMVERIARLHAVGTSEIILGMGSTELLRMAADTFTGPGKRLVTADPTFEAIGVFAARRGADAVRIPLTSAYVHDLDAMLKAAHENAGGGLIYMCNPNNPTATVTPPADLAEFVHSLPSGYVVLIDEAYHHFAMDMPGYAPTTPGANVIVTRTFSKVYGMAGIRLGYGIASPELIKRMEPSQLANNINVVAGLCGAVALDDISAMQATARRIVGDRNDFMRECASRKLKVIPSYTNFAMLYTGKPAKSVRDEFRKRGIDVGRPFPPMLNYLRVSFGQPEEMRRFWKAWDDINT